MDADAFKGAVVLRIRPMATIHPAASSGEAEWSSAAEVPVRTTFESGTTGLEIPEPKFVRVEDTWWGAAFQGVDFHNLTGFHFRFVGSDEDLAHLQFWVAGEFKVPPPPWAVVFGLSSLGYRLSF